MEVDLANVSGPVMSIEQLHPVKEQLPMMQVEELVDVPLMID